MKASAWHRARRAAWVAGVAGSVAASACQAQSVSAPDGFASSFEVGEPAPLLQAGGGFGVQVDSGPGKGMVLTAKPGVGFSGLHALHYRANAVGNQQVQLFKIDLPVRADTQLSYVILPHRITIDPRNPSNYIAVDLVFDDGSRLSARGARDQHRAPASAQGQGQGRVLYPDQWNYVAVDLGKVAAGRRVRQIVLNHEGPSATADGWVDDIRIGAEAPDTRREPADFVDTRRGSNANGHFSRGNNFPAVALPHGFNFWTPVTNAGSDWLYQYQEANGPDNRPRIQAFQLSHEPSPWMGERQTLQLMPEAQADGVPILDRAKRALSFSHANEVAQAHDYRVAFDNGIVTEMVPTDHAALFRFTFAGKSSQLLFDNLNDHGGISLDPDGRSFSGYSDVKSDLSTGATRMFFAGSVDQPVLRSGRLSGGGRDHVAAWFGFDTSTRKTVNLRVATSLIGVDQARHNLALEIAPDDTLESVRDRARQQWNRLLGAVQVDGASRDEKTTLYSNLYRLHLYPNEAYENTGSAAQPVYRYASPFAATAAADTPTHTGARILDGKVYVNNGLWDTYRTAWPAYTLLTPTLAGELIDGFVQQYRDSGWIARWSSPGYADLMVGTSADVAFADAWLKGVRNFDVRAFYQAALKDASVVSPIPGAGRKGLQRSIFNGYTDTGIDEGLSWSTAGYLNDFAIGNLAAALATAPPANDPYAADYADDARWLRNRALGYVNLFDPAVGFFVGRAADGTWRYGAHDFDPARWGGDYTETDAWNMAFDAPQDGAGLAGLYGGRAGLAKKLDQFFAASGQFNVGSYGGVIHEMMEARDVRMGQYGHSNQPAHHILYMYDLAGQPWKTQDKVRDALSRLYVGSEIGQGYPGDEDNGEMSAWYVFSAAGFYPLRMGTPAYAIGAPYFPHMDIHLENGQHIVINAPAVSDSNRYVQSLRVNGRPWNQLSLPHALLAQGATLDFVMGPQPSRWASDAAALPPSLSPREGQPQPLRDLTGAGQGELSTAPAIARQAALFDNDGSTEASLPASPSSVTWHFARPQQVAMITLTSGARTAAPSSWQLQGSRDGRRWTALDDRHGERFPWPQQTRVFGVSRPGRYAYYRIHFDASDAARSLGEIELLGQP
jgi:predicted alpha-1,2-mannosidase